MVLTYLGCMAWSYVIRLMRNPLGGRGAAARRASGIALSCGAALSLSSCNTPAGVQPSGVPKMLSPEKALIFPPPGGPEILAVINRNYSNAVQQDVILRSDAATPGQNYLKVQLYGPQRPEDETRDGLSNSSLRVSSIQREMRTAFPGVAMATSAEYLQNSYGAFSYASGKGFGNDSCVYAWQQIRSAESMRQGLRNLGRINVTLRLCQSGVTVRDLLTVMYNYTITGSYKSDSWNPYGTAQEPDKGIGRSGSPIYPTTAGDVPMQPGAQTPVRTPPRVVRSTASRPPVAQPAPMVQQTAAPTSAPAQTQTSVVIPPPTLAPGAGTRPSSVTAPARRVEPKRVAIPSPACAAGETNGQTCN